MSIVFEQLVIDKLNQIFCLHVNLLILKSGPNDILIQNDIY